MKYLLMSACLALLVGTQFATTAADEIAGSAPEETRLEQVENDLDVLTDVVTEPEGAIQTAVTDVNKLKKIKVSGYVQARYESDESAVVGATGTNKDSFNVRRARLKASGHPTANTQVVLQLDAGEDKVSTKDAYLDYYLSGDSATGYTVTAGQFKWPFGYQIVQSSSVRETPERARGIRELFPGERDRGVKISSPTDRPLSWEVGLFNGAGANAKDNNHRKDVVGRVRYQATPRLDIGASAYFGETFVPATGATAAAECDKSRYGADIQYDLDTMSFKAEYITADDLGLDKSGYYVQLSRNVTVKDMMTVMYDVFDDGNAASTHGKFASWNVGWTRRLDNATRVRAFYEINDEERNDADNNVLRVEFISLF